MPLLQGHLSSKHGGNEMVTDVYATVLLRDKQLKGTSTHHAVNANTVFFFNCCAMFIEITVRKEGAPHM
jgi:hypothetical protein